MPQAQVVGPRHVLGPPWFLSKKLDKLVAGFLAEGFGKGLGQERGLELRIDLGKEQPLLCGKEPDKELWLLLGKQRKK